MQFVDNNSSFLKGYIYPQPLINKLTVNGNLMNSYKCIGMTFDLLQSHPELFETTASNLLYLMNININYKPNVLYEMFKTIMTTNSSITSNNVKQIFLSEVFVNDNTVLDTSVEESLNLNNSFTQTSNMLYLMVYYLKQFQQFNEFEPIMTYINDAFNLFKNNPIVSYQGQSFNLKALKPLCYSVDGYNFYEDLIYWGYYLTFFINGRPYRFYDEIGSDSISSRLFNSVNDYFVGYYKKLCTELQINYTTNWVEIYSALKQTNQLETLKNMLNNMLKLENIILLRNNEMNKSNDLLNECFRDQNVLSRKFIQESFNRNMDKIVELVILNNPFTNFEFNLFKNKTIEEVKNYHELIQLTEFCITNSNPNKNYFEIDEESFNFNPFQENKVFETLSTPTIKSNINEFVNSKIKRPFTHLDLLTKIASSYIWTKLIERKNDGVFQQDGLGTEEISISTNDFNNSDLCKEIMNIFINGIYQKDFTNINLLFNYFKPVSDMLELSEALRTFYPTDYYRSVLLPIMMLSYFKDGITEFILNKTTQTGNLVNDIEKTNGVLNNVGITGIETFNLHKYFFGIDKKSSKYQCLQTKLENLIDSYFFVTKDGFARFVNIILQDLSKYLLDSKIEIPLVIGNDDDCLHYAIGGIELYDKMIEINPFMRGYYYQKMLLGNSEKLEYFQSIVKYFDDVSQIELIKSTSTLNTIKDILYNIGENHIKELIKHQTRRNLCEYQITLNDTESITASVRNFNSFISLNSQFLIDLLTMVYKNTTGATIENKVICAHVSNTTGYVEGFSENKFGNGDFCVIEESNANTYDLPLFKFRGSFEDFCFKFTNPSGTKLLSNGFNILDNNGYKSLKVLIFTSSPLQSSFNHYDISDI